MRMTGSSFLKTEISTSDVNEIGIFRKRLIAMLRYSLNIFNLQSPL